MSSLVRAVVVNALSKETQQLAKTHGLQVSTVTWEDAARAFGSSVGPHISDLTLCIDGNVKMPVIRSPNFLDMTWDQPMETISLVTGNESTLGRRTTMTLKAWLEAKSLYRSSRDSHVIVSAQSCFLSIPEGETTKFNVALYNYQSRPDNPAVLVLVGNSSGTSAQTIGNSHDGNMLYFNDAGKSCAFMAQRLKDDRQERGVATDSAVMDSDEQQRNCLIIVQIPLLVARPPPQPYASAFRQYPQFSVYGCGGGLFGSVQAQSRCLSDDIDHAMVSVAAPESGKLFPTLPTRLERDERFPVRVTLQFYKATSNGIISDASMAAVSEQLT